MAVQRSQSSPGQFRAGVAAAQAGYGGRGRGHTFESAHSDQHEQMLASMDDHQRRIAALEDMDPTTMHAATGQIEPPGPEYYMEGRPK